MPVLKKHSFESKSFLSFFQNNDKLWRNYGLNCGELWQKRNKLKKLNKFNMLNRLNQLK